jgi:hypothetical protein
MLDMVDEVVFPAFFDEKMSRNYGRTNYFFYDVNLINLSKKKKTPVIGILGRIIKDTTLEREQIYKEGKGLIKDSRAIMTCPHKYSQALLVKR